MWKLALAVAGPVVVLLCIFLFQGTQPATDAEDPIAGRGDSVGGVTVLPPPPTLSTLKFEPTHHNNVAINDDKDIVVGCRKGGLPQARVLPSHVAVSKEELTDIQRALVIDVPLKQRTGVGEFNLVSLWKKCRHITGERNCGDMTYQSITWLIYDMKGHVVTAVDPPYPSIASRQRNPVFRRGKGLKFINSTHVVGLLGSAVQPPYPDYRAFIWNIMDNTVTLYPLHSHHDVEFNPIAKTFLTLTTSLKTYNGAASMEYIDEIDFNGNQVWHWNGSALLDYVARHDLQKHMAGCTSYECRDKIHGNTLIWFWEHGYFYLNSRHMDAFYKIECKRSDPWGWGRVLWGVGRVGHFKLFDQTGRRVHTIVYHSHQLNVLEDGRFVMFDNGRMNTASSVVVVRVDEIAQTAQVEYRHTFEHSVYQPAMGGVMRTPLRTYMAALGYGCFLNEFNTVSPGNASVIEPQGDHSERWRMHFAPGEHHGWMYYRVERFYGNPLITLEGVDTVNCEAAKCLAVHFIVWNTFYTIHNTTGRLIVATRRTGRFREVWLVEVDVAFRPFWAPTKVTAVLPCMGTPGTRLNLKAVIANAEGFGTHLNFNATAPKTSNPCPSRLPCVPA